MSCFLFTKPQSIKFSAIPMYMNPIQQQQQSSRLKGVPLLFSQSNSSFYSSSPIQMRAYISRRERKCPYQKPLCGATAAGVSYNNMI